MFHRHLQRPCGNTAFSWPWKQQTVPWIHQYSVQQMCPELLPRGRCSTWGTVAWGPFLAAECTPPGFRSHHPTSPRTFSPDSPLGGSSGLNSWLMATSCSLVTSETMTVDLRRSSMCTECHSPGKTRPRIFPVSSGFFLTVVSRDTPLFWHFNILLNELFVS